MGGKPEKPYPEFPLFPHARGQWAKKIGGKLRYFGVWADATAALNRYLAEKDTLHAGNVPVRCEGVRLVEICSFYLLAKKALIPSGDLTERTYAEYKRTTIILCDAMGDEARVESLRAADFDRLRSILAKRFGPTVLSHQIQKIRSIFKYAHEADIIDRPVKFGPHFKGSSKRQRRAVRNDRGQRMFHAGEIRRMVDAATPSLKAAILLGINCGFGQTDVSRLPTAGVDFDSGWIDFARPKTGVHRRCSLWPETIEAMQGYAKIRHAAADKANSGLFFLTRNGAPLVEFYVESNSIKDSITLAFRRLLRKLQIVQNGLGFYALRHTFQTIADAGKDFVAVKAIMGHADSDTDMSAAYREGVSDDRLFAASQVVRAWLFCAEVGDSAQN